MYKTLGILGGMGPLATADLFRKITIMTEASCDQEHLRIIIDSNTQIPDRTAFIISDGENPTPYLIKSAKLLESFGADCIIMPCNTAHFFYEKICSEISIPFLNMLDETAKELSKFYTNAKKIGLLATAGTIKAGIYDKVFQKYNLEIIKPDEQHQQYVTELIYDIKKGIYDFDLSNFLETIEQLKQKQADVFILGCTEIPVAFEMFKIKENAVDPTTIIAKSAIRFLGKKLKKDFF